MNETVCLNSKGGRNGIPDIQPSLQDRIYSIYGISTAITTSFLPSILITLDEDNKMIRQTDRQTIIVVILYMSILFTLLGKWIIRMDR